MVAWASYLHSQCLCLPTCGTGASTRLPGFSPHSLSLFLERHMPTCMGCVLLAGTAQPMFAHLLRHHCPRCLSRARGDSPRRGQARGGSEGHWQCVQHFSLRRRMGRVGLAVSYIPECPSPGSGPARRRTVPPTKAVPLWASST